MKFIHFLFASATALTLAACAPSDHLFVTTKIANFGVDELPDNMERTNLIGTVFHDEGHFIKATRANQSILYMHGVKEGSPEYGYRVARVNTRYLEGLAWYADGEYVHPTAAAVPDHIPRLKKGDIVEFRHVDTWRTLTNFASTGEGNIVIRVLCHSDDPNFRDCEAKAPHIGKWVGGLARTEFPASAKSYGFTFTPAYDSNGKPLRPLAEYQPR